MKNFFTLFLFLLCSLPGISQNYFETSWVSGEVKYTALVIFYSDTEAVVRVKYYANGADKVAGYICSYKDTTLTLFAGHPAPATAQIIFT